MRLGTILLALILIASPAFCMIDPESKELTQEEQVIQAQDQLRSQKVSEILSLVNEYTTLRSLSKKTRDRDIFAVASNRIEEIIEAIDIFLGINQEGKNAVENEETDAGQDLRSYL